MYFNFKRFIYFKYFRCNCTLIILMLISDEVLLKEIPYSLLTLIQNYYAAACELRMGFNIDVARVTHVSMCAIIIFR